MDDELKRFISDSALETRRHFDVVAGRLKKKVELVAEGVLQVERQLDSFRSEVERRFDDTQAVVKLSYSLLDARIETLESRIERLESAVFGTRQ